MRRLLIVLALTSVLHGPTLRAQVPASPTVPACPSTTTLDQLITAIDAAVTGPANKDRACFRALFLPDARLIPLHIAADGSATPHPLTVDGWVDAVAKNGGLILFEHQIKVRTETFGHLAHLWSTYETRSAPSATGPDGKPVKESEAKLLHRGINSIQAVFDGKQWRILQIAWQDESPAEPLPEKYL